jgi:hypothetical protein
MAVLHRVRQGIRDLLAFTHSIDYELAAHYLTPNQLDLLCRLRHAEQYHSLNVLRDILKQGDTPDDLAVAALLHDVGKSRYKTDVFQKSIAVVIKHLLPDLFRRWSEQGDPSHYLQRPCMILALHPQWSAEMVAPTDVSQRSLWLIAHHADKLADWEDHAHFHLLKRLRRADDAN